MVKREINCVEELEALVKKQKARVDINTKIENNWINSKGEVEPRTTKDTGEEIDRLERIVKTLFNAYHDAELQEIDRQVRGIR